MSKSSDTEPRFASLYSFHFLLELFSEATESISRLANTISKVVQSCPTLSNPRYCSPPGSSVHGILQARVLEWGAIAFSSVQFSSVTQSCPTLCDPMNRSTPGLTVHHQLPEFTQTHVRRVCDAIQPSHPRSSPSSPAPKPSQHQSLFQ